MSVDVACGELAFVDITFAGLESLPGPGEERRSRDLLRSPGGGAITAVGLARLGLSVALVSPIGGDPDGDFLRAALSGSATLAVRALALHPLVPSVTVAREIFDGYRAQIPALAEVFGS